MPTHPHMLLAYDFNGDVVATLDYLVIYDETKPGRPPLGLVDFAAHEEAGGEHTDIWSNDAAVGSKTWPEWIGGRAHEFTVELDGSPGAKRIVALVHKESGHRRERAAVGAEIERRLEAVRVAARVRGESIRASLPQRRDAEGRFLPRVEVVVEPESVNITDLVGSPEVSLELDNEGRTKVRVPVARLNLPLIGVALPPDEWDEWDELDEPLAAAGVPSIVPIPPSLPEVGAEVLIPRAT